MAFQVDCPRCKLQLLGIDTADGNILAAGITQKPEDFACGICGYHPMEVTIISEEEFNRIRDMLADDKGSKLFVSVVSKFPCVRCKADTERRLLGYWRKCRFCGKWMKTKNIIWEKI